MKISPARTAAFDILMRIENDKAFSSVVMPMFEEGLAAADRSLSHQLVLGTLRRQIYLDRVIDVLTGGKKIDVEVRLSLRLALYQLYFLDKIPQYSAINESVNLVQRAKKTSAKGFVNAVLRRASREKPALSFGDEIERVSVETSHPRWLIEKWHDAFGIEETAAIARANNEIPNVAFRVIGRPDDEVRQIVDASRRSEDVEGAYIADKTDHRVFDLAQKGLIYIQDEASQLTAQSVRVPTGGRFLDVCAAPGGKTGLIAARDGGRAAMLAAGDLHWPRLVFLRDNCLRQGAGHVRIVQFDAERGLPFGDASFDVVLVDAPCSGTGTLRRNPEIRYFLTPGDFGELSSKQLSILNHASNLVKPGGSLIYSTCSLEPEENEQVCGRFLETNGEFSVAKPNVGDKFVSDDSFARTWPHRDERDGFFIAEFRKA